MFSHCLLKFEGTSGYSDNWKKGHWQWPKGDCRNSIKQNVEWQCDWLTLKCEATNSDSTASASSGHPGALQWMVAANIDLCQSYRSSALINCPVLSLDQLPLYQHMISSAPTRHPVTCPDAWRRYAPELASFGCRALWVISSLCTVIAFPLTAIRWVWKTEQSSVISLREQISLVFAAFFQTQLFDVDHESQWCAKHCRSISLVVLSCEFVFALPFEFPFCTWFKIGHQYYALTFNLLLCYYLIISASPFSGQ